MIRKPLLLLFIACFCTQVFADGDTILRVVQISDVQLGFTLARAYETGRIVDSNTKDTDARYFEEAVKMINNLSPSADLILNTGDIVNDPASEEQWNRYMEIADQFKAPVYEIMGNHDGWSNEGVEKFKKRFGTNDFYSFKMKECLFIVLNSWYLKHPEQNAETGKLQKVFAENVLGNDTSLFRVLVMHFPTYVEAPDEADAYFNLPAAEREWLLNLVTSKKVKLVLTGHSHRNVLNCYGDSVTLITTGPVSEPLGLNNDKSPSVRGFRIIDINLNTGTFSHKYIELPVSRIEDSESTTEPEAGIPRANFSFVFLGDTHFDKPEHHDMKWVLDKHPGDTSQIRMYSWSTTHILPVLYNDIRTLTEKQNVDLVLHTGDFTEGLCGNYSLAHEQLDDFIDFADTYLNVPYLLCKGNHDITGPGADSAYRMTIFPYLTKQTGRNISDSKFTYIQGNTAFFIYDSYNDGSLEWLENEFEKHRDIPIKFVIMHEPVVPINGRSKWTEFSEPEEYGKRERLINLLGKNNAIVLAGHLHCYGLVFRETENGAFIQLSGSSVPDQLHQEVGKVLSGADNYGKSLIKLEPEFSPSDRKERLKKLRDEKPWVRHFEYAQIQGYIMVTVKGNEVYADIYSGTGFNKWKTINLTNMFQAFRDN